MKTFNFDGKTFCFSTYGDFISYLSRVYYSEEGMWSFNVVKVNGERIAFSYCTFDLAEYKLQQFALIWSRLI